VNHTRLRSIVNREIALPEKEKQDANRLAVARGRKVEEVFNQNYLSVPVQMQKVQSFSRVARDAPWSKLFGIVPKAVLGRPASKRDLDISHVAWA